MSGRKVQFEMSDKAALNLRLIKAKYELTNEEALNKMLEFVGSEF